MPTIFTFTMRILLIFFLCFTALIDLSNASFCHAMTKEQAKSEVSKNLLNHYETKTGLLPDYNIKKKIGIMVDTIDLIKSDDLEENIYLWIEESMAYFIDERPFILLPRSKNDERLFEESVSLMRHRFQSDFLNQSAQLIAKRTRIDDSASIFRRQFYNYIVMVISASGTLEINTNQSISDQYSAEGFLGVYHALGFRFLVGSDRIISLDRSNKTDNLLLNLALLREFQRGFLKMASTSEFYNSNLFSPTFNQAQDMETLEFDPKNENIKVAIESAMHIENDKVVIDVNRLWWLSFSVEAARIQQEIQTTQKGNTEKYKFLVLRTEKDVWSSERFKLDF